MTNPPSEATTPAQLPCGSTEATPQSTPAPQATQPPASTPVQQATPTQESTPAEQSPTPKKESPPTAPSTPAPQSTPPASAPAPQPTKAPQVGRPRHGVRNLFVNGLAPDVDDAMFKEWFAPYGVIQSSKVMLDVHSGISRGFGFVLFMLPDDASKAMTELQGKVFGMSALQISPAQHDGFQVVCKSARILVRNLPLAIEAQALLDYFAGFGKVVGCQIRCDVNNSDGKLNIATVTYDTVDDAMTAVETMHGKMLFPECTVPVLAKPTTADRQRRHHNEMCNNRYNAALQKSTANYPPPPQYVPPQPQPQPMHHATYANQYAGQYAPNSSPQYATPHGSPQYAAPAPVVYSPQYGMMVPTQVHPQYGTTTIIGDHSMHMPTQVTVQFLPSDQSVISYNA